MATKEVKICDVFGVAREVRTYDVIIRQVGDDDVPSVAVDARKVDLGPRGIKRMVTFLDRGCTPPPPRVRKTLESPDVPGQEMLPRASGEVKSNG